MTIELMTLLTAAGGVLSLLTFFLGRTTAARSSGMQDGELKADIRHIKETQDTLKEDIRQYGLNYTEVRSELEKIKGRVSKLEEIIRIYHREESL